jgi:hypothetical protein
MAAQKTIKTNDRVEVKAGARPSCRPRTLERFALDAGVLGESDYAADDGTRESPGSREVAFAAIG